MKLAPVVDIIVATGTCLMLAYGARLVLAGQLTAGALVVFLLYLGKMYKPMRDLSKMTRHGVEGQRGIRADPRGAGDRRRRCATCATRARATTFKGAIAFEHVSFGYSPDELILDDVSFTIAARDRSRRSSARPAAARPPSSIWSRASTIRCPAPCRSTARTSGGVTIRSLRDQISFVLQDTLLFHAPIWQNIAYGRPEANRAEIVRAAELANAHEFITEMPEGYDTMVGERGVTLSGGQRQRIAIARAVIRDTPILVLDEPTSGLDAQSEQAVFEALDRLMKGKTSIVIAHHLADDPAAPIRSSS